MADVKSDDAVSPKVFASFYIQVVNHNHPQASGVGVHGYTADPTPSKKGYGIKRVIATEAGYVDLAGELVERREAQLELRAAIAHAVSEGIISKESGAAISKESTKAKAMGDPVQPQLVNIYDIRSPYQGPHNEIRLVVDAVDQILRLMLALEDKPSSICIILPTVAYGRLFSKGIDKLEKNGYKANDGVVVPYVDELRRVVLALAICEEENIVVRFNHDDPEGSFGRDHALINAEDGLTAAIRNTAEYGECNVSPAQGYWSYKADRSPWLNKSRMLMMTLKEPEIDRLKPRYAYLLDHESNKHDKESVIGQTLPGVSMSVVRLPEMDGVLDNILLAQTACTPPGEQRLFMAMLDNVYRPGTHQSLYKHGADYLRIPGIKTDLTDGRGVEVTYELYPPRQSYRAISKMDDLEQLLEHSLKGIDLDGPVARIKKLMGKFGYVEMTRITDRIFTMTEDAKGKKVYGITRDVEMPNTTVDVQGYYPLEADGGHPSNTGLTFKLSIGMDTPKRNALAAMAGEGIQAYLLTHRETDISISYYVLIVKGREAGVWTTPYANRVFLDSTKNQPAEG